MLCRYYVDALYSTEEEKEEKFLVGETSLMFQSYVFKLEDTWR